MSDFTAAMQVADAIEAQSKAILDDPFATVTVTDASGRKIEAMRLKPSERFMIKRMMGAESGNVDMFDDIFLLSHCRQLDGETINRPTSPLQAMALMDRLKDEGLMALDQAVELIYNSKKNNGDQA